MNNLKSILLLLSLSYLLLGEITAQVQQTSTTSITIDECYQWSRENYPLIKQLDLIDQTTQFSLANAANGKLPRITLNGQATYQSDVTQLPIENPNFEIPTLDKDQYKIYAEIYQPLTNFSQINANRAAISHNGEIEKQKTEIDLYKLRNRINQLFFGVLLIQDKLAEFETIETDLDSALFKINAAIKNGTATRTDQQLLLVEKISLAQRIDENKATQMAFLGMLSTLTGQNIFENTELIKPVVDSIQKSIKRPELKLLSLQKQSIALQQEQIKSSLLPNAGLFAQGGYGRPALNFLSNDFDFYYVVGVKINWNLSGLYNYKNSRKSLDLSSELIAAQEEVFLLNTSLTQTQQSSEIRKYQQLLQADQEIIKIRETVLETARVQLSNGLITTIDFVNYLNEVNQARQKRVFHQTQLLLAQFDLRNTNGI